MSSEIFRLTSQYHDQIISNLPFVLICSCPSSSILALLLLAVPVAGCWPLKPVNCNSGWLSFVCLRSNLYRIAAGHSLQSTLSVCIYIRLPCLGIAISRRKGSDSSGQDTRSERIYRILCNHTLFLLALPQILTLCTLDAYFGHTTWHPRARRCPAALHAQALQFPLLCTDRCSV